MKTKWSLSIWLGILVSATALVAAERCPSCEVSDASEAKYDHALDLSDSARKKAEKRHLPYGVPKASASAQNEHMLHQKDFVVWYDNDLREPLWVAYKLTRKQISKHRARTECFRADHRLAPAARAECTDYLEPVFDQGHLAPNADFTQSEEMMVNTYLYSNMTPQFSNFNRHTWERLEEHVREWCDDFGDLYVVSGCVFDRNGDGVRDADSAAERMKDRVGIPSHFYKIIFKKQWIGPTDTIAILLPHENGKHTGAEWERYITANLTTIARIEKLTGTDFLPGVTGSKRQEMENYKAEHLWRKE